MKPINRKKFVEFQEMWGRHFLDKDVSRHAVIELLGTCKQCPDCKIELENNKIEKLKTGKVVCCSHCKKIFNYRTKTFLEGRGIQDQSVCLLMLGLVVEKDWSNLKIGNFSGLSHHSVRIYRDTLEEHFNGK